MSKSKVSREKAAARRKMLKSFRESTRLLSSLSPEQRANMEARFGGKSPSEVMKQITRAMLADEVRHFRENTRNEPLDAAAKAEIFAEGALEIPSDIRVMSHDVADLIDEDNVIEMLEMVIEGDEVIDDAATHQWLRKKLEEYRASCEKIDANAAEIEAFTTTVSILHAFDHYDILIDPTAGDADAVGIMANALGRSMLPADGEDWQQILPDESLTKGFLVTVAKSTDARPSKDLAQQIAKAIADNTTLRVAMIKPYGEIEPIEGKPTENYHGLEIPKMAPDYTRDWKGDEAALDRYLDVKVEHEGIMSLTDYQLGRWCDRHPDDDRAIFGPAKPSTVQEAPSTIPSCMNSAGAIIDPNGEANV